MNLKLILILFFCSYSAISQEIFIKAGNNFTKYNYKDSAGTALSGFEGSSGSNYDLGVEFFLDGVDSSLESPLSYSVSLSYNQFNDRIGTDGTLYVWNTNYLGIQNMVYITLFKLPQDYFSLKLKGGINMSTILNGQQYINNVVYNLANYREFKGLTMQPTAGIDLRLEFSRDFFVNVGYSYSNVFNASNTTSEKLSFTNNQLQFGISFLYN